VLASETMLFYARPLIILAEEPERIVVRGSGGVFVFDRRRAQCSRNEQVLIPFDQIQCIDVLRGRDDNLPDVWSVALRRNWWSKIVIGTTADATDASIVAAHISTATGRKVRSLK
jgi:hypothetical protein